MGALVSYLYPRIIKKETIKILFFLVILYALSITFSPLVILYGGAFLILIRNILDPIIFNLINSRLNRVIESKYRATALSTFNMIRGIPYAVSIYLISYIAGYYPTVKIASIFGIIMMIFILWGYILIKKPNSNQ